MSSSVAALITIGLYLVASAAWWASYRRGASFKNAAIGTLILLLGGIDRAFWISPRFADKVRWLAQEQGWYHQRRILQTPLTILLTTLAVSVLLYAIIQYGRETKLRLKNGLTLFRRDRNAGETTRSLNGQPPFQTECRSLISLKVASVITLIAFCCIRTLSHHNIDYWFLKAIAGIRIHWMIEWSLLLTTIYFVRRE